MWKGILKSNLKAALSELEMVEAVIIDYDGKNWEEVIKQIKKLWHYIEDID